MMGKSTHYRQYAAECQSIAETLRSGEQRSELLILQWNEKCSRPVRPRETLSTLIFPCRSWYLQMNCSVTRPDRSQTEQRRRLS